MNNSEIVKQIKEAEEHLAALREKLEEKKYPLIQESKVGDVLKDKSIVVHKFVELENSSFLLAAPASTAVTSTWSNQFSEVFEFLEYNGFNPSEWFIPNVKQLQLAYKNVKSHFASDWYWSSDEHNSKIANGVLFSNGDLSNAFKSTRLNVRAFRFVIV